MKYTIEVEAEELSDLVNLLREITRLVRETRIVPGREVQYCMGAYRVVEGDGVWCAAIRAAMSKAEAEAKRLRAEGDEYDGLIAERLDHVAAQIAGLLPVADDEVDPVNGQLVSARQTCGRCHGTGSVVTGEGTADCPCSSHEKGTP